VKEVSHRPDLRQTKVWRQNLNRQQAARSLSKPPPLKSKYEAKQAQGWKLGEAVEGIYSFGTFTTVFKRAITYKNWLVEEYPWLRFFEEIDYEMTTEYLNEKAETRQPDTVQTIVATLRKLQEGLYAMNWIKSDIVPWIGA
jgi:hypothetical protein